MNHENVAHLSFAIMLSPGWIIINETYIQVTKVPGFQFK